VRVSIARRGTSGNGGSGRDSFKGDTGCELDGDEGGLGSLLADACRSCNLELRLGLSKKGASCSFIEARSR
jgi:hypothetical protein